MSFQTLLSNDIEKIPYSESLEEFESEYKCLQVIGEGGFGKVRKAVQSCDQRSVAIKFVADKKITSWQFYQKDQKYIPMEIALMCRCRDVPGIIQIIKYFQIKQHKGWYIVMERFERYVDLFDHITNLGHITEPMALHFMTQLLNIVMNCYKLGICHRDIKDENIIIDLETMKIYLIDFGAGGILHDGIYKDFDGTRVYSPPEWIKFKQYNVRSLEVWSLGILLFDMVCGNLPFDNDDSIVNCKFSFRRSISFGCQDLINRCLQFDSMKRIEMSDILHHPWFNRHSKINSVEPRNRSHSQFHVSTVNVAYNPSSTSSHTSDNDSGMSSLETSPFSSPQSSGLDDLEYVTDDIQDQVPSSSQQYLFHKTFNCNNNIDTTPSYNNYEKA